MLDSQGAGDVPVELVPMLRQRRQLLPKSIAAPSNTIDLLRAKIRKCVADTLAKRKKLQDLCNDIDRLLDLQMSREELEQLEDLGELRAELENDVRAERRQLIERMASANGQPGSGPPAANRGIGCAVVTFCRLLTAMCVLVIGMAVKAGDVPAQLRPFLKPGFSVPDEVELPLRMALAIVAALAVFRCL